MKAVVYQVTAEDPETGNWPSYATRRDADRRAREFARTTPAGYDAIEVHRCVTVDRKLKDLVALLLDGPGWCAESEVVARFEPTGKAE